MLSRPFKVELVPLQDEDVSLRVSIRFASSVTLNDEEREALEENFRALALYGASGGLCGRQYAPLESTMVMLGPGRAAGYNEWTWSFDAKNIDPGTLFMVENMAHWFHAHVAEVTLVRLESPLFAERSPPKYQHLPPSCKEISFGLENDMENAQVVIEADFAQRQKPEDVEPFRKVWEAWEHLCARGAFADDEYIPEEINVRVDDDVQIASTGFFTRYTRFAVAEGAFDGLVNLLQAFHERVAAIEHVEMS